MQKHHVHHGFDADNRERRSRLESVALCPDCGEGVYLWTHTDRWHEPDERGRRRHWRYSRASGHCRCGAWVIEAEPVNAELLMQVGETGTK